MRPRSTIGTTPECLLLDLANGHWRTLLGNLYIRVVLQANMPGAVNRARRQGRNCINESDPETSLKAANFEPLICQPVQLNAGLE
jgi:hypothetical protein